jgi:hypothetical protein
MVVIGANKFCCRKLLSHGNNNSAAPAAVLKALATMLPTGLAAAAHVGAALLVVDNVPRPVRRVGPHERVLIVAVVRHGHAGRHHGVGVSREVETPVVGHRNACCAAPP